MVTDLPRIATTSKHWLWLTGATALILFRDHPCAGIEPDRLRHVVTRDGALDLSAYRWMGIADHDPLPDIDAPGTMGALLALVRAAWSDPTLSAVFDHDDGRWCVGRWEDGLVLRGRGGATEAEALISALLNAP